MGPKSNYLKVAADKLFAGRNTRIRRTAVVITVVIKAACKPGRRPLLSISLLHFLATHAASLPLGSPVEVEPSKCRRPRRCRRQRRRGSTWRGSGGSATTSGAASRTHWRRTCTRPSTTSLRSSTPRTCTSSWSSCR